MGFLERLGLLAILSGALPAQQPAKSTEGPQPRPAFMDVTSALGVDFQYMAFHTPSLAKGRCETQGSTP